MPQSQASSDSEEKDSLWQLNSNNEVHSPIVEAEVQASLQTLMNQFSQLQTHFGRWHYQTTLTIAAEQAHMQATVWRERHLATSALGHWLVQLEEMKTVSELHFLEQIWIEERNHYTLIISFRRWREDSLYQRVHQRTTAAENAQLRTYLSLWHFQMVETITADQSAVQALLWSQVRVVGVALQIWISSFTDTIDTLEASKKQTKYFQQRTMMICVRQWQSHVADAEATQDSIRRAETLLNHKQRAACEQVICQWQQAVTDYDALERVVMKAVKSRMRARLLVWRTEAQVKRGRWQSNSEALELLSHYNSQPVLHSAAYSAEEFDELDTNNDGMVDKSEWDAARVRSEAREESMSRLGGSPVPRLSLPQLAAR